MTTCDSKIVKFTLEWRNIVSLPEARGVVLTDKFKILWHTFEICKDAYFVEYMGHKQEAHEDNEIPTPSLTVDKLLKFVLEKYTDQSQIDNHVWGLSSKREAKFVTLAAEVTTLKGVMKLAEKIAKKQNPNRGGGGAAPKSGTSDKHDSKREKAACLTL